MSSFTYKFSDFMKSIELLTFQKMSPRIFFIIEKDSKLNFLCHIPRVLLPRTLK